VPPVWRKTCATTALGCARKRRSRSATSPPGESQPGWRRNGPTSKHSSAGSSPSCLALGANSQESQSRRNSHIHVPLAATFVLASKPGKEVYVVPVVSAGGYRFTVKIGTPDSRSSHRHEVGHSGSSFLCLMSGTPMGFDYLRRKLSWTLSHKAHGYCRLRHSWTDLFRPVHIYGRASRKCIT